MVAPLPVLTPTPTYWDVSNVVGVVHGQTLRIRRLDDLDPMRRHSCYEVECRGGSCVGRHLPKNATYRFCFPSVIVTGIPKCGTSAMYELLTRFPHVHLMPSKENCPFARRRSHWQFFNSLPSLDTVRPETLIVDGCIDLQRNMLMHTTLRGPDTLYVVMTRDYADYLWSSYNFWCKAGYDQGCNSNTRQLDPALHTRSPEHFHALVAADAHATTKTTTSTSTSGISGGKQPRQLPADPPPTPLYNVAPCAEAQTFFSHALSEALWATVPRNATLVLASEELAADPFSVWQKAAAALDRVFARAWPRFGDLGTADVAARVGNISHVRINANTGNVTATATASASGGKEQVERRAVPASATTPGLYPASHHRPLLPATRALLGTCWRRDCLLISQATGYVYPSCRDTALELIRRGHWRSFTEIYHTHGSSLPTASASAVANNQTTWPLDPPEPHPGGASLVDANPHEKWKILRLYRGF